MFFFILLFISPYLPLCLSILPLSSAAIHELNPLRSPLRTYFHTHIQAGNNKRPINLKLRCCFFKKMDLWCTATAVATVTKKLSPLSRLSCQRGPQNVVYIFSHICFSSCLAHRRGFLKRKRQVNSSSTMHFHLASLECLLFCFSHGKWKAHG